MLTFIFNVRCHLNEQNPNVESLVQKKCDRFSRSCSCRPGCLFLQDVILMSHDLNVESSAPNTVRQTHATDLDSMEAVLVNLGIEDIHARTVCI